MTFCLRADTSLVYTAHATSIISCSCSSPPLPPSSETSNPWFRLYMPQRLLEQVPGRKRHLALLLVRTVVSGQRRVCQHRPEERLHEAYEGRRTAVVQAMRTEVVREVRLAMFFAKYIAERSPSATRNMHSECKTSSTDAPGAEEP